MHRRRHLVLCFDGTWNRADQTSPTNVVKTFRAVAPRTAAGLEQLRYYDAGVGTGRFDRIRGGIVGLGLARNVEQAYGWLIDHYRPGDRLLMFGYSRGAYTARSLAGLLGLCGIPDAERCHADGHRSRDIAREGMQIYRQPPGSSRQDGALFFAERWARAAPAGGAATRGAGTPVHFVGVWDTVGALGVPIGCLGWLGARRHRFHDVRLGRHIRHACHAVAIDERRRPFAPTLWRNRPVGSQGVEQVWFPGVHGDIGGGRDSSGLSDGALLWMWSKAWTAGLAFRPGAVEALDVDPLAVAGDSLSGVYRLWGARDRPVGECGADGQPIMACEAVHWSAVRRLDEAGAGAYRDGVAGRTLLPALERGLVAEAAVGVGESDPVSVAWDAPNPL